MSKLTPVDDETAANLIGEGVHVGLRKGSEAPSSATIWHAINVSDDGGWSDAVKYCIWGLKSMGYVICKEEPKRKAGYDHGLPIV